MSTPSNERKSLLDSHSSVSDVFSVNTDLSGKLNEAGSQKISVYYAAIALFKCVVGTGSFFLPFGVLNGGLYGGFIGLVGMGILAIYLNWIIMDAKIKTFGNKAVSYNHLCEALWGDIAGKAMYWSVILTNAGACSVYLVTMAGILIELSSALNIYVYMVLFLVAELFVAFVPSFKYLSWTSILGDCALALAIGSVIYYGVRGHDIQPPWPPHYPAFVWPTYYIFFSTVSFLYIQPSTLFPIANSMKEPRKFNMVQTVTYAFIILINTLFGTVAYMFFGEHTKANVVTNLCPEVGPCTSPFVIFVQCMLIVDVFFTFPIIMAPAFDVIEDSLFVEGNHQLEKDLLIEPTTTPTPNYLNGPKEAYFFGLLPMYNAHWKKCIVRAVVLLFVGAFALAIPDLTDLLGIVTGVTVTFNGFVMGPLCHLKVQMEEKVYTGWWWRASVAFHGFLILAGIALGAWTVYSSVTSFVCYLGPNITFCLQNTTVTNHSHHNGSLGYYGGL